ncbi:endonuclease/exonuclease/phosphatase family protein [Gillisia sp. M10.2A]|uniref:Endonuclease/exonuclease/phosphatase family protein n=1 Tax=Gillisia lutea TaxID=2909668 RepID=A0ABS9EFL2_9FLAO|nr:endonuclease/exonuclease/phosphatase family protein [Gillisia lutea]MCF4101682.1 endonuclease/exonuclease/phosphatase family protein [Gillisia lutea]
MKLKPFLQGFGIFAVVLTLIPIAAADFWWIRMFDYPHIQLTILTFVALMTYFIKFDVKWVEDYVFVVVLAACFLFQLLKIYPYLPHSNYEVGDSSPTVDKANTIKFYAANVLQKNTNPDLLIKEIEDKDPDILLLTETDKRWQNDVASAVAKYPYKAEMPLDNTYGMLLYSKLKMKDPKIRFLIDDSIPSIHTILKLRSGKEISFHAIHPTPPMPQENPSSTDRDGEMMLVAEMAMNRDLPVIVAGDFNDVAWSGTSTLFREVSRLLDVRVGRGFYNSFDVKSFILRWPLDHFFVSEEFRVSEIKTGESIDSDHYPFTITLSLEPERAAEQKAEAPSKDQLERANEQIKKAKEEQAEKNGNEK